jgi:hypothetical protein
VRRVVVEVTAEDIAKGEKGSCERCPIALALARAADMDRVHAHLDCLWGWPAGDPDANSIVASTPIEASNFIDDFDSGEPVNPFTFTVELP